MIVVCELDAVEVGEAANVAQTQLAVNRLL